MAQFDRDRFLEPLGYILPAKSGPFGEYDIACDVVVRSPYQSREQCFKARVPVCGSSWHRFDPRCRFRFALFDMTGWLASRLIGLKIRHDEIPGVRHDEFLPRLHDASSDSEQNLGKYG
jgi:hypothetical protein